MSGNDVSVSFLFSFLVTQGTRLLLVADAAHGSITHSDISTKTTVNFTLTMAEAMSNVTFRTTVLTARGGSYWIFDETLLFNASAETSPELSSSTAVPTTTTTQATTTTRDLTQCYCESQACWSWLTGNFLLLLTCSAAGLVDVELSCQNT